MQWFQSVQMFLVVMICLALTTVQAKAQSQPTYWTGTVMEVLEQREVITTAGFGPDDGILYTQLLSVQKNGTDEIREVVHGTEYQPLSPDQLLRVGETMVLVESPEAVFAPSFDDLDEAAAAQESIATTVVEVADQYRLPTLALILGGFFALVLAVAGWRGGLSIVGMGISLLVLSSYVVPQILAGANPIVVSTVGAVVIAALTVYLSHGFSIKSHLALISMMLSLLLVAVLATATVIVTHLTGFGSEEANFLAYGATSSINMQGLLLGGILLGALGVLDDICVSQISTVIELRRANPKLSFPELYAAGMRVGKDHVASLVNTLVLAYAGANLPLFLLFSLASETPTWVHLNSELLAEEIVRTLVGSIGLVVAVPLTTLLVAFWAVRQHRLPAAAAHQHAH